tara:strand:+ start:3569 stop:4324 length:756 start_codon:yes stop_codon:yes gene_type:complete
MDTCLIIHPQDSIQDFFIFNGLVRYLHKNNDGKTIYFILESFYNDISFQMSDLNDFEFEVLEDLNIQSILKILLGKYQNVKIRHFFGEIDKFRLDNQKNTFSKRNTNEPLDIFDLYNLNKNIIVDYFKIKRNSNKEQKIISNVKNVANLDFAIYSSENIPTILKKNSSICLMLSKMFSKSNYFESICIIERCKKIYICDRDVYTIYIYLLYLNKYISNNNITFIKTDSPNFHFSKIPEQWTVVEEKLYLEN